MKKGLLQTLFVFSILLIRSVSASFHYGSGLFDLSTIIPFAIFAIFFALIFAGLSRTFNPSIAGVLSAATAFLIYYYLFYRTGFDLQGLFFNFGISNDFFYPIFSLIFLLIAIWVILRFGFSTLLLSIGLLLIALASVTDIFYEKGVVLIAGIVLTVLGILFKLRGRGVGRRRGIESEASFRQNPLIQPTINPQISPSPQKRRVSAYNEEARGRNMSRSKAEAAAYEEEARRQKAQQKELRKQHEKLQKAKKKAEKAAYREEARRSGNSIFSRGRNMSSSKAEAAAYKEDARRQKAQQKAQQKELRKQQKKREKAEKAAYREEARRNKELKKRYKEVRNRLNSMPGGSYIKKGSPGYNEYISLYREAQDIRNRLGT